MSESNERDLPAAQVTPVLPSAQVTPALPVIPVLPAVSPDDESPTRDITQQPPSPRWTGSARVPRADDPAPAGGPRRRGLLRRRPPAPAGAPTGAETPRRYPPLRLDDTLDLPDDHPIALERPEPPPRTHPFPAPHQRPPHQRPPHQRPPHQHAPHPHGYPYPPHPHPTGHLPVPRHPGQPQPHPGPYAAPRPGPPPRPPRRRRRKWPWVLLFLFVIMPASCCGGVYLWARPYVDQYPASIADQADIPGLRRATNPDTTRRRAAEQVLGKVESEQVDEQSSALLYTDERQRTVAVLVTTRFVKDPEKELSDRFTRLTDLLKLAPASTVEAGPLGGHERCANGSFTGKKAAVCGWADHGSLAIGVFTGRSVDESADLLRTIRASVVRRG